MVEVRKAPIRSSLSRVTLPRVWLCKATAVGGEVFRIAVQEKRNGKGKIAYCSCTVNYGYLRSTVMQRSAIARKGGKKKKKE